MLQFLELLCATVGGLFYMCGPVSGILARRHRLYANFAKRSRLDLSCICNLLGKTNGSISQNASYFSSCCLEANKERYHKMYDSVSSTCHDRKHSIYRFWELQLARTCIRKPGRLDYISRLFERRIRNQTLNTIIYPYSFSKPAVD
jgi:hypothetical protein